MTILRPYQEKLFEDTKNAIRRGVKRIIIQAATGSGKTIYGAKIAEGVVRKGNNILFLVDRRDLVYQAKERFESFGLGDYIGVIMAGEESQLDKQIQIGTIQTYARRILLDEIGLNRWFHKAQVVIVDEADSSVCQSYMNVLKLYKENSIILGLSAVPLRADGRGLGLIYDAIVTCEDIASLTQKGFLVPMRYYAPSAPDLSKIKIRRGDYDVTQLNDVMDQPKLVGDIYSQWIRLGENRQTIIFCVKVSHSKSVRSVFERNGVSVAHIDARTPHEERMAIYEGFTNGELKVIVNVGIATRGTDLPCCSCVCIARPSKSFSLYRQCAGRALRPYAGKKDAILIDFSGVVSEHGFVDDPVTFTLSDKEIAYKKKIVRKKEKKILTCDECMTMFTGHKCPRCGFPVSDYGKKIETLDAELVEVGKTKKPKPTMQEKQQFYSMALHWQATKLKKDGTALSPKWAVAQYKQRYGVWPRGLSDAIVEHDDAFERYVKYLQIRRAKHREKEQKQLTVG